MQNVIGIALVIVGLLLLYFGYQEGESFASSVKESITGSPTDRSIAFMIGGIVLTIIGAGLMFVKGGRTRA